MGRKPRGSRARGSNKQPLAAGSPPAAKKTPLAREEEDWRTLKPTWKLNLMDLDHDEWGWSKASPHHLREVHKTLSALEGNTWRQIIAMRGKIGPYNGLIEISKITSNNPNVAKRIQQLGRKQIGTAGQLMKIRIRKRFRVWGIMEQSCCFLFWCDPLHTVWPLDPVD